MSNVSNSCTDQVHDQVWGYRVMVRVRDQVDQIWRQVWSRILSQSGHVTAHLRDQVDDDLHRQ